MNTDRELMQQALEALEQVAEYFSADSTEAKTITALRERLAQPDPSEYWRGEFLKHNTTSDQPAQQQEPVAWLIWLHGPAGHFDHKQFAELEFERRNKEYPDPDRKLLPLYTSPPASKPWVGLSTNDLDEIDAPIREKGHATIEEIYRAIEAKLKEKNV